MILALVILTVFVSAVVIGSEKERKPDEDTVSSSKPIDATSASLSGDSDDGKRSRGGGGRRWKKHYERGGVQYKNLDKKLDKILADLGTLTEKVDALQKKS